MNNYKKLDINELATLITSKKFDKLKDEEAFEVMQRYNELKGYKQLDAENKLADVELGNITIDIIDNDIT